MKKIVFVLILCVFALTGCANDKKENTSINTTRTLAENSNYETSVDFEKNQEPPKPVETQIGTYTTTILDKTPSRVNNIKIASESLNGTIVKSGETFSFCDTLGDATPEQGYEPATCLDENGDTFQDYGGGKCQLSSTLYCVVKDLPGITVTERHAHSRKVYYVPEGYDAAVSYDNVDFKFRNDLDKDVRIDCSSDGESLTVNLIKFE